MGKKRKLVYVKAKKSSSKYPAALKRFLSEKRSERKEWSIRSIKCTLGPFVKDPEIKEELANCVHWISLLSIHTHHVLLWHALKQAGCFDFNANNVNKAYRATLRALTNTHRLVSFEAQEIEESAREYVNETGFSLPRGCITRWMQHPLEEAAKMSTSVIKTHFETNLLVYLKRVATMKIDLEPELAHIKSLPRAAYREVFSCVVSCLATKRPLDKVRESRSSLAKYNLDPVVWEEASSLVNCLVGLLPSSSRESFGKCFFNLLGMLEPYAVMRKELYESGQFSDFQRRSGRRGRYRI